MGLLVYQEDIVSLGQLFAYPFKRYNQNLNSHLLPIFISYRSTGEKLIKY